MPRYNRVAPPGIIVPVLNRGNDRRQIFDDDADYAAFERVLTDALAWRFTRVNQSPGRDVGHSVRTIRSSGEPR